MFQLKFSRKLMNCPTFPDEVLSPFVPSSTDTRNATPGASQEPYEDDTNSDIPYSPLQTSKKGKEKLPAYSGSKPTAVVTPSSPPKKRVKIATFSKKKKRSQLQATEIAHYYSSNDDHPVPVSTSPKERSKVSSKGHKIEKEAVRSESEDSDMEITKEVRITVKSLQQMAKAAKQRPGLRSSS